MIQRFLFPRDVPDRRLFTYNNVKEAGFPETVLK